MPGFAEHLVGFPSSNLLNAIILEYECHCNFFIWHQIAFKKHICIESGHFIDVTS